MKKYKNINERHSLDASSGKITVIHSGHNRSTLVMPATDDLSCFIVSGATGMARGHVSILEAPGTTLEIIDSNKKNLIISGASSFDLYLQGENALLVVVGGELKKIKVSES